jgi:hypothetical protein
MTTTGLPTNLDDATRLIMAAKEPGELFPPDRVDAAKLYRSFARLTYPDVNDRSDARDVFERLTRLWEDYGKPQPTVIHGDIADLFPVAERTLLRWRMTGSGTCTSPTVPVAIPTMDSRPQVGCSRVS